MMALNDPEDVMSKVLRGLDFEDVEVLANLGLLYLSGIVDGNCMCSSAPNERGKRLMIEAARVFRRVSRKFTQLSTGELN